jgi:hypothetical protein
MPRWSLAAPVPGGTAPTTVVALRRRERVVLAFAIQALCLIIRASDFVARLDRFRGGREVGLGTPVRLRR